jgi:hypothetical protein
MIYKDDKTLFRQPSIAFVHLPDSRTLPRIPDRDLETHLNGLSQVISSPLLLDDGLVDLSGRQVVVLGESDVEVTLVVSTYD